MALACVLDASAAAAEQIREAAVVMAPELLLSEVANTLWNLQRAGHLADLDPQQLLAEARDLVDRVEADRHLQQLAERVLP